MDDLERETNKILGAIGNPIIGWLCGLVVSTIVYVFLMFMNYDSQSYKNICTINDIFFKKIVIAPTLLFIICFTILIITHKCTEKRILIDRFYVFIFMTIFILSGLVFVTGGMLDSPISGAAGLFISLFLLMQDDDDLKRFNKLITFSTIILLIIPYILLFFFGTELFVINWSATAIVLSARIAITIIVLLSTVYTAYLVNLDLQKVRETNT